MRGRGAYIPGLAFAEIEVESPAGYIDVLNKSVIIEIKEFSQWKHALGQILSYGRYYQNHNKIVYLFGDADLEKINMIRDIYIEYNVELKIYVEKWISI